jgi:hypothetical protein
MDSDVDHESPPAVPRTSIPKSSVPAGWQRLRTLVPSATLRRIISIEISLASARYVALTWRAYRKRARKHGLPGRLAITLTSHPPRFRTLALTLKGLLSQSVRPDSINLWIAEGDFAALPQDVLALQSEGVSIRRCADMRVFTKIIPALIAAEDDFLLTCDDDVYYPRHWLAEIVGGYRPGGKEIVCARAYRITLNDAGRPRPYHEWDAEVPAGDASTLLMPTGVGGVLWDRRVFHSDVTRRELFEKCTPRNDDFWLYWMALMNGATFRKVGPRRRIVTWHKSQEVGLILQNAVHGNANDLAIAGLVRQYGFPAREAGSGKT